MPMTAARVLTALLVLGTSPGAFAQALITPTPPPTVTAENEPWFQDRTPLVLAGRLYYPAGAQTHFNGNEMVRMGYYGLVPIYMRTTLEPYSVIFVPLAGGVMQPYERRRSGDLAGTAGSFAPSFPIDPPNKAEYEVMRAQSALTGYTAVDREVRSLAGTQPVAAPSEAPVPTTGSTREIPVGPEKPVSMSALKPEGLNGIFVTFNDRRWFSLGPATSLDRSRLAQTGTYNGLPVYADPAFPDTIYVPVAPSTPSLVAPYTFDQSRQRVR